MSKPKRKDVTAAAGGAAALGSVRPVEKPLHTVNYGRVFDYEQDRDTWKSIRLPLDEKKGLTAASKAKKWTSPIKSVSDERMTAELDRISHILSPNVFYSILPLYSLSKQFSQAARVEFIWPKNERQPLVVRLWKGSKNDPLRQIMTHEMTMCPMTLSQT